MKNRWKALLLLLIYLAGVVLLVRFGYLICAGKCHLPADQSLILSLDGYHDDNITSIKEKLIHRIQVQPFNLIATALFACAIIHTFFAHYFTGLSEKMRQRNIRLKKEPYDSFAVEVLRFLGEVEVVFGIWVIPLFIAMAFSYNWNTSVQYINGLNYLEPTFVVVIMTLASTGPIIKLAEDCVRWVARLGGESASVWWWVIMTIGPLSGSLITEPGAMTISAFLLSKQFYELRPSPKLSYATLGLLFTNISVGGVFTSFAAPPVLLVSKAWNWDTSYMMTNFGWKAVVGILLANAVYYVLFRSEFKVLEKRKQAQRKEEKQTGKEKKIPFWISLVHVIFLVWTVAHNHYPAIFVGAFLLFLGFYEATLPYQKVIRLRPPVLVGFFLAGLVAHGTLQGWWIAPLLENLDEKLLFIFSTILTSFNDNAEITFLATLIPTFDEAMKYAVVAGAVTGGGLTVIANAPNPSGQTILKKYFHQGISAISLLAAALFPTIIMGLCFYLLRT
ncbi:MAG: putative Na+/H+ antiporter [Waddliaceae bacterium]